MLEAFKFWLARDLLEVFWFVLLVGGFGLLMELADRRDARRAREKR